MGGCKPIWQGCDMDYECIGGDAGKDHLLLVHGLLSSRNHWAGNVERLSERYNLVVVDLPAHGSSAAPLDSEAWHPDAMVAGLDAIRAHLGVDRWFICGQSFGAGITIRYALSHPARIIAQAFTNARTAFRDEAEPSEHAARAERIAKLREGGAEALRRERFHPRFARRFPDSLRETLSRDADRIDVAGYIKILEISLPSASLSGRVADCKVPSLLINGRHERIFQPVRHSLETDWPGLEIVDIDGGHSVNIENPEGFDAELLAFFGRYGKARSQERPPA